MEKIKLLQIVGSLNIGGTESVAMNITRMLKERNFQCDFLVFEETNSFYEQEARELGCKIIKINSPSKGYWKYFKTLVSFFKTNSYDIVHSHITLNSGIVLSAAKLANVKCKVSHAHFTDNGVKESFTYKIYKNFMRKLILNNADVLISCGEDAGKFLYGKNPGSKSEVLNNGINLSQFQYKNENRYNIRNQLGLGNDFIVGHVGRFSEVKNHKFLIEVFSEIKKRKSNSKLLLVGDGELKPELESLVNQHSLIDSVIFMGNKSNVNEIMSAMDVFIFPSYNEGLPLTLIEAQTSNLPCLISNTITKEVKFNDSLEYLSLSKSAEIWAQEALNLKDKYSDKRTDQINEEIESAYSVESVGETIFNIYYKNLFNEA